MLASAPLRELLESGLHRLAQPLTTSMWVVEETTLRGDPEPKVDVPRLSYELRRAVGVLNAVRAVLDGEPGRPDIFDACEQVEAFQKCWLDASEQAGVKFRMRMPQDRCCVRVEPMLFKMACEESWHLLMQFATRGWEIAVTLSEDEAPQLCFSLRAAEGEMLEETQRRAFTGTFDPFDTPGFAFAGPPSEAFLLRVSLASGGCVLHTEASADYAELRWTLPAAVRA